MKILLTILCLVVVYFCLGLAWLPLRIALCMNMLMDRMDEW